MVAIRTHYINSDLYHLWSDTIPAQFRRFSGTYIPEILTPSESQTFRAAVCTAVKHGTAWVVVSILRLVLLALLRRVDYDIVEVIETEDNPNERHRLKLFLLAAAMAEDRQTA